VFCLRTTKRGFGPSADSRTCILEIQIFVSLAIRQTVAPCRQSHHPAWACCWCRGGCHGPPAAQSQYHACGQLPLRRRCITRGKSSDAAGTNHANGSTVTIIKEEMSTLHTTDLVCCLRLIHIPGGAARLRLRRPSLFFRLGLARRRGMFHRRKFLLLLQHMGQSLHVLRLRAHPQSQRGCIRLALAGPLESTTS